MQRHQQTVYLNDLMGRLSRDTHFKNHADALLEAARTQEPLLTEAFQTPQDPRHHAEGPFLINHLRLALVSLFSLLEGTWHVLEVEEFHRLKGYEGELEELEQTIKEHAALFEVYVLCHDVAKWSTIAFSAPKYSPGAAHGFEKANVSLCRLYINLYQQFARQHHEATDRVVQELFYQEYQIDVYYPFHDRAIFTPVYEQLLNRYAAAHGCGSEDVALLQEIIVHHTDILKDFSRVDAKHISIYERIAQDRGFDSDDFLDVLQGALLLDVVCGSRRIAGHDPSVLIHFLRSELDASPERRAQKEREREDRKTRERNQVFREVGLDGIALMELLRMSSGPIFGKTLHMIHEAIIGQTSMPKFAKAIDVELEKRTGEYYKKVFE